MLILPDVIGIFEEEERYFNLLFAQDIATHLGYDGEATENSAQVQSHGQFTEKLM